MQAIQPNVRGDGSTINISADGVVSIAEGGVGTDELADGALSADAAGRAKMAAGFLSADATGRAKMADGFLVTAKAAAGLLSAAAAGRALMDAGFLSADAAGRAKMADAFLVTSKAAAGLLSADAAGRALMSDGFLSADATGLAKMADGFLSADASGRAKMADLFLTTAKASDLAVTLAKLVEVGRTAHLRGALGASPNIILAQGTGHQFPVGFPSVQCQTATQTRRLYIREGTWQLGVARYSLLLENLGALDTFTAGLAKNGSVLGSVTYQDGDAIGLERTVDLSAHTVSVGDYLTLSYSQSSAAVQDNRPAWDIPMVRTA